MILVTEKFSVIINAVEKSIGYSKNDMERADMISDQEYHATVQKPRYRGGSDEKIAKRKAEDARAKYLMSSDYVGRLTINNKFRIECDLEWLSDIYNQIIYTWTNDEKSMKLENYIELHSSGHTCAPNIHLYVL